MSQSPSKAVFLSYASQDAEAAKRIADALRIAGVEVWFDAEGGLEHGDEWDRKIRRQIKDCVLFIAVISANTQAREEGYFRIEWELAAQRALGIAAGVAFILPVVIDDTREPAALVPDRFRSVQWTRLPGGNVPPDVLQRFLKLWSHRAGVLKQAAAEVVPDGSGNSEAPRGAGRSLPVWPWLVLGVLALGVAYLIFKPRRSPEEIARVVADAQKLAQAIPPPAPEVPPSRDWPKDPELRRAMDLLNGTEANSEDFTLAEEIANRVLAQRPTDPEAVTVMARAQGAFLMRGFDRSDERVALARRYGERAVQVAPNDAEALAALGSYVARSDQARAVELLNRAIALKPAEPFFYRQRDNAMFNNPQVPPADSIASAEKTAALFPNDALAHYELARHYRDLGRGAEMERELDRTIAITPIANAVVWKSRVALWVRGDPVEMKALIDRVPARVRSLERVVFSRWAYAMATGQWEEGRIALEDLTSNWIEDFDYVGPKALLAAQLLEQQHKPELARLQYEAALAELRARQARTPGNATLRSLEVWIAHGLGRDEEARTLNRTRLETIRRPYQFAQLSDWWFSVISSCLLIGDRATALTLIREAVTPARAVTPAKPTEWDRAEAQRLGEGPPDTAAAGGRAALRMRFKFDPRMAPFRGDPEIQALLAEPAEKSVAAAPNIDDKSVAVLAFANLSDDKANEYFSDGISEELLTVLQKIPGLHVAARTSAFSFKGKSATAQEIGDKLGVATLVEGSVRKSGNSVRITARLSRAATGEQLWSESYTRDLKDVFAVQSELAETIVGQLRGQLGVAATRAEIQAQVSAAEKGGTKNLEAHELYLQGKYFLNRATLEDTAHATALLQRAVELDPSFALAWAALSGAGWFRGGYGNNRQDFDEGFALARRAADQAVAIEPALAAGHIARLDIQSGIDFDWQGAKESLRRAQTLAPDDVAVIFRAAQLAYSFGQMERAVELIRQTAALDPVNPLVYTNEGYIFLALHRLDDAAAAFRRVQELSPASPWGHAGVAMTLVAAGRSDAAATEAARESNEWSRLYALSLARWGQKDRPAADKVLAELIAGNADVAAYQIASVYAYRGETDRAFEWLERAYRQRDPGLGWGKEDFFLQGLHADPRWPAFLKKLGVAGEQLP